MTPKEKAKELLDKMTWITINGIEFCNEYDKQCALIAVERNILMFTELVNRMDDFSNESRQVMYQLIENEEEVKQEIEKL
jgi:hypothetical protein